MPQPDDTRDEALRRLDEKLDAIQARRVKPTSPLGGADGAGEGYRLLAGLIGGMLGGLGLGWFFDQVAHTSPIGLICGLLIGTVGSIVGTVFSALRMSARMTAKSGTAPMAPAPNEDDD
jgi:ATP synthase protein I